MAILIVVVAFAWRLYAINFGLPALNDPDELMFELGAIRMLRGGSLNPGWFGHPATTTMYVLAIIDVLVFLVGKTLGWFLSAKAFAAAVFSDPSYVILPGRIAMAMFGGWSVWLTHKMARNLFGEGGWIAATVLALSPVAISWSQVVRSDIMATVFLQLSLLAVLRYYAAPSRRDFLAAGAWLGVAMATKWPFSLGFFSMVSVMVFHYRRGVGGPQSFWLLVRKIALFGFLTLFVLFITSPYILLSHETVARNLSGEVQHHHLGATGGSLWFNAWWYLSGPLMRGLGAAGLLLAAAGILMMWRVQAARLVICPVLMSFALVLCGQHLVWERWVLPLLPFLAIAIGYGTIRFHDDVIGRYPGVRATLYPLWALVFLAPLVAADFGQARARMNDTRQLASAWAIRNIPPGSTVMIEHFGFDLYSRPWRVIFPLGNLGCVDAKAILRGQVDYSAIERAREGRSNVDYGTMPSRLSKSCLADYYIISQYDRYVNERSSFPDEINSYENIINNYKMIAEYHPVSGESAGPEVRILKAR